MVAEALTREEISTLSALAMRYLDASDETRAALQATGVNVIPCNFYSTVPSLDDIDTSFELAEGEPYERSRIFDVGRMKAFLARIDGYAEEFDPPAEGDVENPDGFFWSNPLFSYSDAMSYYCMLRHLKPKTVIEIGSGFSTLVARQALDRNGGGRLVCIEPYPHAWLPALDIELHRVPVQSLTPDFFNERLVDGDVLFIDSTHTVKAGSDCLQIYLRILPELRANLTIHAHDIYLPMPMPRADFDRNIYWTEQYLLMAYLLDNPRTKVVFGSRYLWKFQLPLLEKFMRGRWCPGGASFWFTRRGHRKDD